jgi:hypothetical protein
VQVRTLGCLGRHPRQPGGDGRILSRLPLVVAATLALNPKFRRTGACA